MQLLPCRRLRAGGMRMAQRTCAFLLLLALPLSVHTAEAEWFRTQGEEYVGGFIQALQERDREAAQSYLSPHLLTEESREEWDTLIETFPQDPILKFHNLYMKVHIKGGEEKRKEELRIYAVMADQAIVIDTLIYGRNGKLEIHAFQFEPAPMDLMKEFPYTVFRAFQPNNVFMVAAVFNGVLALAALVVLMIQPVKQKLLWIPVIFVGVCEASAQWLDDGLWDFKLLAVKFPLVWIESGAGGEPWSVITSFPLGAIVVLFVAGFAKKDEQDPPFRMQPPRGYAPPPNASIGK